MESTAAPICLCGAPFDVAYNAPCRLCGIRLCTACLEYCPLAGNCPRQQVCPPCLATALTGQRVCLRCQHQILPRRHQEPICAWCMTDFVPFTELDIRIPTTGDDHRIAKVQLLIQAGTTVAEVVALLGAGRSAFKIQGAHPGSMPIWHRQLSLVHQDLLHDGDQSHLLPGPLHHTQGIFLLGKLAPLRHAGGHVHLVGARRQTVRLSSLRPGEGLQALTAEPYYALVGSNGTVYTNDVTSSVHHLLRLFCVVRDDCFTFLSRAGTLLHPKSSLLESGFLPRAVFYVIHLGLEQDPIGIWSAQDSWPDYEPHSTGRWPPGNANRWRSDETAKWRLRGHRSV